MGRKKKTVAAPPAPEVTPEEVAPKSKPGRKKAGPSKVELRAAEVRARVEAAGGKCECRGECGEEHCDTRCGAPHGVKVCRHSLDQARWIRLDDRADPEREKDDRGELIDDLWLDESTRVMLGSIHVRDESGDEITRMFCQRCRLRHDGHANATRAARSRKKNTRAKLAWRELFPVEGEA